MRASTHTTCSFAALSRTIIIPTFIPDFSSHLSHNVCILSILLTHESAELLGTVLPLPPPSLSYDVSVSLDVGD